MAVVVVDLDDRRRELGARPGVPRRGNGGSSGSWWWVISMRVMALTVGRPPIRCAARSTPRACASPGAAGSGDISGARQLLWYIGRFSSAAPSAEASCSGARRRARAAGGSCRSSLPRRAARGAGRGARRPGTAERNRRRGRGTRSGTPPRRSSRARRRVRSPLRLHHAEHARSVPSAWPIECAIPAPPPSMARPASNAASCMARRASGGRPVR